MSLPCPIAIVGRGCVLPGAAGAGELWQTLQTTDDLLSRPPPGAWPIDSALVTLDGSGLRWSDRGGHIRDFSFDPYGFAVSAEELLQADPCVHWVLHAARSALQEAGHDPARGHRRIGAILGHLSLPLRAQGRLAVGLWLQRWAQAQGRSELAQRATGPLPAAFNRYMSALPSRLLARAFQLEGAAFTLDAACASSLYALKLACDALADGRADLMLAGAVCGTDPMFLHIGFRALNALSPTGQSRPFDRQANGLVPSEGAVVLALKRLADAESAGDRILGVIRGVGLSNDGGAAGLLTPSSEGQVRAIREALAQACLAPQDVTLLECHATGTPVGDTVELASIRQAYDGCDGLPIGSLKSQIGHLLTVSGGAGLLKILGAFEAGVLPRSLPVEDPIEAVAQTPVRLLAGEEPWPAGARRIAGISSFGFGGNNAHLLVEAHEPGMMRRLHPVQTARSAPSTCNHPLAIIGLAVTTGTAGDTAQFVRAWQDGTDTLQDTPDLGRCGLAPAFELAPRSLRFPPRDLADSLPQQVVLLKAAAQALAAVRGLPAQRTGVYTGMECDPEIGRQMARALVPDWIRTWGHAFGEEPDAGWAQQAADAFAPPLQASMVTGSLPNVVANRLNVQYRLAGPSFSVCADELSGLRALEMAARALREGELDAAIVSAVDMGCEPVNAWASPALEGAGRSVPADAAVVLVLKRMDDALRDADPILAWVDPQAADARPAPGELLLGDGPGATWLGERYGHAHAASGLLHVAAAVIACGGSASPGSASSGAQRAWVRVRGQGGQWSQVRVGIPDSESSPARPGAQEPATSAAATRGLQFAAHMPPISLPDWPLSLVPALPASSASGGNVPLAPTAPHPSCKSDMNELAPSPTAVSPLARSASHPPKPLWTRADLEEMSHGRLSRFFGKQFEVQDGHARQVRMPMPPLLLADRVMSIEGEPGSMGLGRIVTETDITAGAWYLHEGSMPAGLEVEAGQADLLLISYLGADLLNRGERVYRLLGCEMTYHGEHRPRVGDTLRYEIEIVGHACTGNVRLFFFRYDSYLNGKLRLSVRNGRAGFFTTGELENAGGVIWDPASDPPAAEIHHTPPAQPTLPRAFDAQQVRAFSEGRAFDCFGAGFESLASHHRTPRIQAGPMQLFQEVEQLDPQGGPWGRGYLCASYRIQGDEWFFPGHFKNDPTMPGTLMCEAGVQMMGFYLAALGHTKERDGWTFELVPGLPFKAVCRGQVTPASREMRYEILVRGLEDGHYPTLWADVLLTVDGRKAFHGRNLGVRLWPDVPLRDLSVPAMAPGARPPAEVDGFLFDGAAMLHCATGLPSLAFGPLFTPFDGTRNLPRLPSSPYQFMSRATRCVGPLGGMQIGSEVDIEYDIPDNAWYFADNDGETMPFAVLLEAALQPCGWLAAYMGVPLHCETDLRFRNLDGDGVLHRAVRRGDRILRTTARCTSVARNGDTFIESFDVRCVVGDSPIYTLKTVFGHFTAQALSEQKGLPVTPTERSALNQACSALVDLRAGKGVAQEPQLARGQLLMLDRVTAYWPQGGAAGRGRLIAEFDVDPRAWFFKAHFYRDPVQPGSLGIEAMIQLLQFHMRDRGLAAGIRAPRFEPLATGRSMAWKYRGQVLPANRTVTVEMDIVDEGRDETGPWVSANAWLWVDGLRIYQARNLSMRIVEGAIA